MVLVCKVMWYSNDVIFYILIDSVTIRRTLSPFIATDGWSSQCHRLPYIFLCTSNILVNTSSYFFKKNIFRTSFLMNNSRGLLLFRSLSYGLLLLIIIQNKNYPLFNVCNASTRIFQDIICNGIALKLTGYNRTRILRKI